jgi:hypothetical protein
LESYTRAIGEKRDEMRDDTNRAHTRGLSTWQGGGVRADVPKREGCVPCSLLRFVDSRSRGRGVKKTQRKFS